MKLNEVLNTVADLKVLKSDYSGAKASFTANGNKYQILITREGVEIDGNNLSMWEIVFYLEEGNGDIRMDITGTGGQFEVYSTVFTFLRQHVSSVGVLPITMVAEDAARLRLYPKLIRRFFPHWSIQIQGQDITAFPPRS